MSDAFTIDSSDIRAFQRRLDHMSNKDFRLAIRKVHRKHAGMLAKKIKQAMPKTGGVGMAGITKYRRSRAGTAGTGHGGRQRDRIASAKKKAGPRHKTPRGAMAASVRTHYTTASSEVLGGNPRAPHYAVNEFGGAVWWRKRRSTGARLHPSPAKRLHTSWATQRARHGGEVGHIIPVRNRSAAFNTGVEGWFFWPTDRDYRYELSEAYNLAVVETIREFEGKTRYGAH